VPDPGTVIRRRNRVFNPTVKLDPGQVTDLRNNPKAKAGLKVQREYRRREVAMRRAPMPRPAGTRRPQ